MSMAKHAEQYVATQRAVVEAMRAWSAEHHPDEYLAFEFPDAVVVGELSAMPEEWCTTPAARDLWLYVVGAVPDATIAMFQWVCEHTSTTGQRR